MRRAAVVFTVLVLSFACARAAAAQSIESWNVTTTDFKTSRVRLTGFDGTDSMTNGGGGGGDGGGGALILAPVTAEASNRSTTLSLDKFISIARVPTPRLQPAMFVALLSDGDRLAGEPVSTSGETLTWNSHAIGPTKIPMRSLVAIVRAGAQVDPDDDATGAAGERRTEDLVVLANGDAVRGIISDLTRQTISIQPTGANEATALPVESIAAVLFAPTAPSTRAAAPSATSRGFRVAMSDGTIVTVSAVQLQGRELRLTPRGTATTSAADATRNVSLNQILSIEQVNGPVMWLSSLAPTENVQTPYLEMSWPARMDATVSGGPIRFANQLIARGIGAHAHSKISFAIPPDASIKAFRTRFAIDNSEGDAPYADVTVRVKLDGKTAFEQQHVRADTPSPVVNVDTNGAKSITLEVDYGANADVQDRFVWIEPALLKFKPAPEVPPTPATLPAVPPASAPTTAPTTPPATRP